MSHTLYKTDGLVLGSINAGEANKYISLFTKDIGLVKAIAKSVREEKSKLRYSLQDFSFGRIMLVRGRDVWRITGAMEKYNMYQKLEGNREKLLVVTRILKLLQRLLQGEERNDYLFHTLSEGLEFAIENSMNTDSLKNFEYLTVLRILHSLGYIAKKDQFDEFLSSSTVNQELLNKILHQRKTIVFAINQALKEGQL